jgi:DNA-binding GntR family transcriptional regulator
VRSMEHVAPGLFSHHSLVDLDRGSHWTSQGALPDQIYRSLKYRIVTCDLQPSARVVERAVCADMNVSRTPLREALNRLVVEGLIVTAPFRGYLVTPLTVEDVSELCELRRINEREAAGLAAIRATETEIAHLRQIAGLDLEVGDRRTYDLFVQDNMTFHLSVARCARNRRLESVIAVTIEQLLRVWYLSLDRSVISARHATHEHVELVEMLARRDAEGARQFMDAQMAWIEGRMKGVAEQYVAERAEAK